MKNRLFSFLIFSLIGILFSSFYLPTQKDKLDWISFEQMNKLIVENPKPIFIDVYTDWCSWCKAMDKTTFKNKNLVDYINKNYYAIKFNAESRDDIVFNGKTYHYDSKIGAHELAIYLTYGRLEFPHSIFMNAPNTQPAPISGYMKAKDMELPLKYFGDRKDTEMSFVDFQKETKTEW